MKEEEEVRITMHVTIPMIIDKVATAKRSKQEAEERVNTLREQFTTMLKRYPRRANVTELVSVHKVK